jgi:hypothetical protein
MDAADIIAGWKQRLTALAESPEYVFRDTSRHLIEKHFQRPTTFLGYPESEVASTEARLGIRLPAVFRQYLLEMAKSPGDLFRGSDVAGITEFEHFRTNALELLAETDPTLALPPEAVVFLFHQGYTFVYLLAVGGFDGPPRQWTETEREPRRIRLDVRGHGGRRAAANGKQQSRFPRERRLLPHAPSGWWGHAVAPGASKRRASAGSGARGQAMVEILAVSKRDRTSRCSRGS